MSKYNLPKAIAKRLSELSKTQRWLAEQVGKTEVSISRYIAGEREPKAQDIMKIAKALGLTTDILLMGETMEEFTKGEKMLIDLGYEKTMFYIAYADRHLQTFQRGNKCIDFGMTSKTIRCVSNTDNETSLCIEVEEMPAIHQICIDYGWIESGVEND